MTPSMTDSSTLLIETCFAFGAGRRTLVVVRGAAQLPIGLRSFLLGTEDRHAASADAATEQSSHQVRMLHHAAGAGRSTSTSLLGWHAKGLLDTLPEVWADYAKGSVVEDDPLALRAFLEAAPLRNRVSVPLPLVPGNSTRVAVVLEHVLNLVDGPAFPRGVLRVPQLVIGRRDAVGVQVAHDERQGGTVGARFVNPLDDVGLIELDDHQVSRVFEVWRAGLGLAAVTIATPARVESSQGASLQSAVGLSLHQLKERVVDQGHRPEGEASASAIGGHAGRAVDDLDSGAGQLPEDDVP